MRRQLAGFLALLLCCDGCPSGMGHKAPNLLGTLAVSGKNAFVNGKRAYTGTDIHDGDQVATGPNTRAIVTLSDGTTVELDQDTDPWFSGVLTSLANVACAVKVFVHVGHVALKSPDNKQCQIFFASGDTTAAVNTWLDASVTPAGTHLTVAEGHLEMQSPKAMPLRRSEQATIANGRVTVRRLSEAELAAVFGWTAGFIPDTPPFWVAHPWIAVATLGIGIAIVTVLAVLLTGGHDEKHTTPKPRRGLGAQPLPPAPSPPTTEPRVSFLLRSLDRDAA
jgi:hypothetical protein